MVTAELGDEMVNGEVVPIACWKLTLCVPFSQAIAHDLQPPLRHEY
jgi:hypothetical protein